MCIRDRSTLHTNDAPSAITRLLDLGVPYYLINATVLGVMAQRLVRKLCESCKKNVNINSQDKESWDNLVAPWKAKAPQSISYPVGCLECRRTGYRERIGLYEVLLMSPELRKIIRENTDIDLVRDMAIREGMVCLLYTSPSPRDRQKSRMPSSA